MENKETQITEDIKDMSLTLNKPYVSYVFKKTLKISQALYLVTDYFSPTESLREPVRQNANNLVKSATDFLKNDQKDKQSSAHLLVATFLETRALLDTATLIHLLSEKNHMILRDEINRVLEIIESHKEKGIQLSKEFIGNTTLDEHKRQNDIYKGQYAQNVLYIKDNDNTLVSSAKMPKVVQKENKGKRLDKMISLFKPGVELMIKDITSHLKDVSEKTIQRELLLLVEQGKLKKIGKKRWSKYRLN